MASTYTQPKKNGEDLQEELKKQVSAQQTAAQKSAADLQKISQQAASLGGYTPSAQLQQAQQKVVDLQQQKPAEFNSAYTQKLQDQFEAIMNRQPFNYDLGTDPLWNQYTDMYVQKGRRAMQDTIGQAAALTGGYGNSYAQGAGQAAYGNYLQELNAMAPEFQQQAYGRWQQEGADMLDRYNALQNRENIEYGRYNDALNNYWAELDRAQQQAADLYNREYTAFTNNREYAYNTALTILQGGKMPSDGLLAAAGLSAEDAAILKAMYKPKKSSSGGSKKQNTDLQQLYALLQQEDAPEGTQGPGGTQGPDGEGPNKSQSQLLNEASNAGAVNLTTTNKSDGIMSFTDWVQNNPQLSNSAVTSMDKAKMDTGYKDYVESKIEQDAMSGKITKSEAAKLINRYLLGNGGM